VIQFNTDQHYLKGQTKLFALILNIDLFVKFKDVATVNIFIIA
jgi:hypothetical protein